MTATARTENPALAIVLRLSSVVALSMMWALVKLLGARGVNLVELIFYRQLVAIPVVYAWIAFTVGTTGITTRRLDLHATRTAIGLTSMAFNFGSVMLLPLAESTTIGFSAPIFATIFSAIFLKEATGIHRWSAVLCGFIGVVIMARPDTAHFPPLGLAVAIIAAIGVASISILLRALSRTETPSAIVFWFTVLSVPPIGILMIWFAQPHDLTTWMLIVAMGICGGIAQLLLTSALSRAPVAVVLPMDYSAIIWAALLGWLFWDTLPIATTWMGAALIVASGLYIILREQRLGRVAMLRAKADADIRA
ncbi:MAG TPA: DMT family transporter [Sphingobium sp.]|uniref:DMT family transporter n=1 Tax=Sphingobium sp. TaxID=1912891 RepID=UPI002ED0EF1F